MKIRARRHGAAVLLAGLLCACSPGGGKSKHKWFGMDTDFSAVVYGGVPGDSVFAKLERETARLEQLFSDFIPTSSLNRLRGKAGDTLMLDLETALVFQAAAEMAGASHGAFDITLHPLKSAWGLASGDTPRIPGDSALAEAMRGNPAYRAPEDSNPAARSPFRLLEGDRMVLLRDSLQFDLGGIAKGYAVDRLHALLDSLGFPNHIVTAGGDMRLGGTKGGGKPWLVGIRHPRADSLAGQLELAAPAAVSTSGDYERFFIQDGIRYHHIFNPRTGRPAGPYCSVTVLAATGLSADGLTKPLFILGPEQGRELLQRFRAEAVWMREAPAGSGRLCHVASPGLAGKLSLADVPACP